eukprot:jgi/Botrbrau1/7435/Bobra.0083s0008.1
MSFGDRPSGRRCRKPHRPFPPGDRPARRRCRKPNRPCPLKDRPTGRRCRKPSHSCPLGHRPAERRCPDPLPYCSGHALPIALTQTVADHLQSLFFRLLPFNVVGL